MRKMYMLEGGNMNAAFLEVKRGVRVYCAWHPGDGDGQKNIIFLSEKLGGTPNLQGFGTALYERLAPHTWRYVR